MKSVLCSRPAPKWSCHSKRGECHLQNSGLTPAGGRTASVAVRASGASVPAPRTAWGSDPVVVVGAGLAGLATARALTKVGIPALVLEAGPGPRNEGAAIGLWSNAWRALDALGVAQPLREAHVKLERMEICSREGEKLRAFEFNECGSAGAQLEYRCVRRSLLVASLAQGMVQDAVRYNSKVVRVVDSTSGSGAVEVELAGGERVRCSALIGADGVGSAVAAHLGLGPPNITGYTALRGIAKFPDGISFMPQNIVRQVWGQGVRFGLSMMSPTECYWFVTLNGPLAPGLATSPQQRFELASSLVRGWSWELEDVVRATPAADISASRLGDRWTMGAYGRGVVTLVGDAAHPMTPNLGQGGCCALEDAVVLARTLSKAASSGGASSPDGLAAALRQYEVERSKRCLPITVRSWAIGELLQLPLPPITAVRNYVIANKFSPSHFLDHTSFDCGSLESAPRTA